MFAMAKKIVTDASFYPSFHRTIEEAKRYDEFKAIKTVYIKSIGLLETQGSYAGQCLGCGSYQHPWRELEAQIKAYPGSFDSIFAMNIDGKRYRANCNIHREDLVEGAKLAKMDGKAPALAALYAADFGLFMLNGIQTYANNFDRANKWEYMLSLVSNPVLQVVEFSNQFWHCLNASEQNFENAALLWRKGAMKREPHDYGYQARVTYNRLRSMGHSDD